MLSKGARAKCRLASVAGWVSRLLEDKSICSERGTTCERAKKQFLLLGDPGGSWTALGRLAPWSHFQLGQKAFLSAPASTPVRKGRAALRSEAGGEGSWTSRGAPAVHTARLAPRLLDRVQCICPAGRAAAAVTLQVSLLRAATGAHPAIGEPGRSPQREVPCVTCLVS